MAMEYEAGVAPKKISDRQVFLEFVAGLQAMSIWLDQNAQNFAYCAALLTGSQDAPARIRGMAEFCRRMREAGFDAACDAIEEGSGVRVQVSVPDLGITTPGIIVGFTDVGQQDKQRFFLGVAVIDDDNGQQAFVNVRISPDGKTYIDLKDSQPDKPETKGLMDDLFERATKLY